MKACLLTGFAEEINLKIGFEQHLIVSSSFLAVICACGCYCCHLPVVQYRTGTIVQHYPPVPLDNVVTAAADIIPNKSPRS